MFPKIIYNKKSGEHFELRCWNYVYRMYEEAWESEEFLLLTKKSHRLDYFSISIYVIISSHVFLNFCFRFRNKIYTKKKEGLLTDTYRNWFGGNVFLFLFISD